jgi:methionyl-tRNA formyltransferase
MPETGVTIMQMVPALDAGDMLHVLRTPIGPETTYGELHDQLAEMGALAIVQALTLIEAGASRAVAQDDALSTYAPKIERHMARLDFAQAADLVSRVARAFDPRPGAFARLNGMDVKCFGARVHGDGTDDALDEPTRSSPPGTVRSADDDGLLVRCGVGAVRFADVQPSGKPRMTAAAWARGRGVVTGDVFTPAPDAPTA